MCSAFKVCAQRFQAALQLRIYIDSSWRWRKTDANSLQPGVVYSRTITFARFCPTLLWMQQRMYVANGVSAAVPKMPSAVYPAYTTNKFGAESCKILQKWALEIATLGLLMISPVYKCAISPAFSAVCSNLLVESASQTKWAAEKSIISDMCLQTEDTRLLQLLYPA